MDTSVSASDELTLDSPIFSVACSPANDVIAFGDIKGNAYLYRYSSTEINRVWKSSIHKQASIRNIAFMDDGRYFLTCSNDRSIKVVNVETGKADLTINNAHPSPIYTIATRDNYIASGDDDGRLCLWDKRSRDRIANFCEHHDFISAFLFHLPKKLLIASSGDGCVSGWDLRMNAVDGISENVDEGILSMEYINGLSNIICGTEEGSLLCYKVGEWESPIRTYPGIGHDSIDKLAAFSKKTLVTIMDTGHVRALSVNPTRWSILGEHEGCDRLAIDRQKRFAVTTSPEATVRFWDLSSLNQKDDDDEFEISEEEEDENMDTENQDDDMDDEDEDEDEDEDDSMSEEDEKPKKTKQNASKPKFITSKSKSKKSGTNAGSFFNDL